MAIGKTLEQHSSDDSERLKFAYAICFSREPSAKELFAGQEFLQKRRAEVQPSEAADKSLEPWVKLCRSLLVTNEFMYVD